MAFDPELATQAWMATLSGAARARSDAYFEGGYWLILWTALIDIAAAVIVLHFGWAAQFSAFARRRTQRRWLQSVVFAAPCLLLLALLALPFTVYTGFVREHQYGLSNQGLGGWAGEAAIGLALQCIIGALVFSALHAIIRRSPRDWWLAGTGVVIAFLVIGQTVAPIFIQPLFNRYTQLPDGPVRDAVVSMARANGVPAENIVLVDASRQSKRISANVAGLFGTSRIALNDNLLQQPVDQIRAVMAHELGHYVLNHIWKFVLAMTLVLGLALLALSRALPWLLTRFGAGWGVAGLADPAILPIAIIGFAIIGLVITPVINTLIRTQEIEADQFGLNVARAPDSFAAIAMKLSQYRKIEPGPAEEAIFFDHPSGHARVLASMQWKAGHLGEPDIR